MTSTRSAPTSSSSVATVRTAQSRSPVVMPPGSGVPVPGAKAGVENVDVNGEEDRPGADELDAPTHDLANAEIPEVVHEEARDSALRLPDELGLPRPVAAQTDLDIATGVDPLPLDEPVKRRAVRDLDSEDVGPRVRVRSKWTTPTGP